MPASPDENLGSGYFQPVAELGLAVDPTAVFSQHMLDFAYGDRDGMIGHVRPVPGLADQLFVVHQPSRILDKNLECAKGARPQLQFGSITKQTRGGKVHSKWTQSNRLVHSQHREPPKNLIDPGHPRSRNLIDP